MNHATRYLLAGIFAACALTAHAETKVVIETNMGNIELSLDEQRAPKSVANFVAYAKQGFYSGTIFHRVIPGFMIQGGGMTADMIEKPTSKAITNEADNGLKNTLGTIAMARTSAPNSATSQFFINLADNDFLNHKDRSTAGYGYAVFGHVTKGMDVVQRIGQVRTTSRLIHQNVPVQPVVIKNVRVGQ